MAENKAEIILDGNISPLRQKLREAGEELKKTGETGVAAFSKMASPLAALQSKFVAIGALLAGGAVFQEAVKQAADFTEGSMKLGRALGESAAGASTFISALEDIDVPQSEFIGAAKALSKEIGANENGLNKLGLKTRDAAGHLRPLSQLTVEAIDILKGYKAGTDRAIVSQEFFGKRFELTTNLTNLNKKAVEENRAAQEELSLLVGEESVQAWTDFDAAGDRAHMTLKAMKISIGNAVIPVLTDLGNWFNSIGPGAIVVIKGALGGLISVFHLLTTGVTVLWETINAMVVSIVEPFVGITTAFYKVMTGDFKGAAAAMDSSVQTIADSWTNAFDVIGKKAQSTSDRIWNLFANPTPDAPETGGKDAPATSAKKPAAAKAKKSETDKSYLQYYESILSKEKEIFSAQTAGRELSKTAELAYWKTTLAYCAQGSKDRIAIEKKISGLAVDIRKEELKQKQALTEENARSEEELALGVIDLEQAAVEAALAIEKITQVQALQSEEAFEQRRYEIRRKALQAKLALLRADPTTSLAERAKIDNAIAALDQAQSIKRITAQAKLIQAQRTLAAQSNQIWTNLTDRMAGLWDKGITAMMNGTLTFKNAFKAIGAEMLSWFVQTVIGEQVKKWIVAQATMLGVKLGFIEAEKAAEVAGSTATVGIKAAETTAVVGANAAQAGTGAAASQAGIPIVGPILALAAMAAVFAAVSKMGSATKSAAKGYDIPRGLNPVVQTHEEEMILPSKYANVIRGMADGQGGSASPNQIINHHINVTAMDSRDVQRALKQGGALHKAIKDLQRRNVAL